MNTRGGVTGICAEAVLSIAGRSDDPIDPPSEWVLQPVSVTQTAFHLKSVDKPSEPDTHWWRWK